MSFEISLSIQNIMKKRHFILGVHIYFDQTFHQKLTNHYKTLNNAAMDYKECFFSNANCGYAINYGQTTQNGCSPCLHYFG